MEKKIIFIKYINIATILLYMITYLFGFFDIQDDFVVFSESDWSHYYDYGMDTYTNMLWYLFLPFSLSIVQFAITESKRKTIIWVSNIVMSVIQLILISIATVMINSVPTLGEVALGATVSIELMRMVTIVLFCGISLLLTATTLMSVVVKVMLKRGITLEEDEKIEKIKCCAYIPVVIALCLSLLLASMGWLICRGGYSPLIFCVAVGIPFILFNVIFIKILMKNNQYISVICAYILYLITSNGVIYHINQRSTEEGFIYTTVLHSVVVLLTIMWVMYKHISKRCKVGGQWKILVVLVAFLVLFVPFDRGYKKSDQEYYNYVYRTPIYTATYICPRDDEDYESKAFSLELLGIEIYRMDNVTQ